MSLNSRIGDWDKLTSQFDCSRLGPLVCSHKVTADLWDRFRIAAAVYMSKCLPGDRIILDEEELIHAFETHQEEIQNITPNGLIVPKRHTILEYNGMVRAFADIIGSLGINDAILSWHIVNLRVKFGELKEANMQRARPSELIHSDSWAGESSESVNTMMFIFGDVARNHVAYYNAPSDFDEKWLGYLPSFADGQEIAKRYQIINHVPSKGEIVLADFAALHASTRLPGSGTRVSLDTSFHLKRAVGSDTEDIVHPERRGEYIAPEVLAGLGEEYLFVFADRVDQHVQNEGGFRHSTNLRLLALQDQAAA